jgi:hypothetical protein
MFLNGVTGFIVKLRRDGHRSAKFFLDEAITLEVPNGQGIEMKFATNEVPLDEFNHPAIGDIKLAVRIQRAAPLVETGSSSLGIVARMWESELRETRKDGGFPRECWRVVGRAIP